MPTITPIITPISIKPVPPDTQSILRAHIASIREILKDGGMDSQMQERALQRLIALFV